MSLRIGDTAPNFQADTTEAASISTSGSRQVGGAVLPSEGFHPVCTTRLGTMATDEGRVRQAHTKIIGLSPTR